jgi:hypothetical protein
MALLHDSLLMGLPDLVFPCHCPPVCQGLTSSLGSLPQSRFVDSPLMGEQLVVSLRRTPEIGNTIGLIFVSVQPYSFLSRLMHVETLYAYLG